MIYFVAEGLFLDVACLKRSIGELAKFFPDDPVCIAERNHLGGSAKSLQHGMNAFPDLFFFRRIATGGQSFEKLNIAGFRAHPKIV